MAAVESPRADPRFRDVAELRVKESDRLDGTAGPGPAPSEPRPPSTATTSWSPVATVPLSGATFDADGDHRMAMAAAVAGACAAGPGSSTIISGWESVATSYPGFLTPRSTGFEHGSAATVTTVSAVMAAPIIAIDGPAGSGKSTLSRALCERLGLDRLDTGAMYRAVAWAALDRGIDPADPEAVGALAESVHLAVGERVTVDGVDVTEAIRGPAVNRTVSVVAANPRVRRAMVERQRRLGRRTGRRGRGRGP